LARQVLNGDLTAKLIEIRVLKAHLKSLRREHSWLLKAYFKLKTEETKKLGEKIGYEILDVGARLNALKTEFPNVFKEA
jgi:hypothetical protein